MTVCLQTLHFPEAEGEIHAGFTKLLSEINRAGAPYALSLASRLYGEQSYSFIEVSFVYSHTERTRAPETRAVLVMLECVLNISLITF